MTATVVRFDPLLPAAAADAMLRLCERYGTYGTYGAEAAPEEAGKPRFAPEIPQRYDAALNFVKTGGRLGRLEDPKVLAARTNYLRETYFYDGDLRLPGIEPFLHHEGFVEAARRLHDRPVVVPSIVYANLLLPGQELAVHTDVPEFRGASRTRMPQWLLVVMQHAGLFESWRRHIATGIAYFGACTGGALAFYPDGPDAPPETIPARHNTAVLLDTDTVFHGVDRVTAEGPVPPFRPGMQLRYEGEGTWRLFEGGETLGRHRWEQLRFSVSWKAYCYADEHERRRAERGEDDLALPLVLDRLDADLRARGRLAGPRPADADFARLLIETYVRFPRARAA